MRRALSLLALALVLTACGARAAGARAAAPERHPPTVMVVFDEFSFAALLDTAGRIDPVLYPHLHALAARADVYGDYTTPSDETTSLFAAMLTSRRYDPHRKPDYRALPRNLFTDFARAGYRLAVREAATRMCPPRLCPGDRPPRRPQDVLDQLARGRIERFRRWLGLIGPSRRRVLWWTHVMLPHGPQVYDAAGQRYNPYAHEEIPGLNQWPSFGDPWLVRQGWQRYQLQLLALDRIVGELLARLRARHLYDRSLLVLTADHGAGFGHLHSHPHEIDDRTAVDIASTPLIVKRPHQTRGRWITRHVRLYDLLPGVARLAHVPTGPTYGRPFVGPGAGRIPSDVVTVDRRGRVRRWSLRRYRRLVGATVARRVGVFGQHRDELRRLWRQGPHPELVGRRIAALRTAPAPAGVDAALTDPARFRAVRTHSGFLPIHVVAKIGGVARGTPFAVAVDGVVQGTGRVARTTASPDFWISSVVAPSSFHDGTNPIDLYLLDGTTLERVSG